MTSNPQTSVRGQTPPACLSPPTFLRGFRSRLTSHQDNLCHPKVRQKHHCRLEPHYRQVRPSSRMLLRDNLGRPIFLQGDLCLLAALQQHRPLTCPNLQMSPPMATNHPALFQAYLIRPMWLLEDLGTLVFPQEHPSHRMFQQRRFRRPIFLQRDPSRPVLLQESPSRLMFLWEDTSLHKFPRGYRHQGIYPNRLVSYQGSRSHPVSRQESHSRQMFLQKDLSLHKFPRWYRHQAIYLSRPTSPQGFPHQQSFLTHLAFHQERLSRPASRQKPLNRQGPRPLLRLLGCLRLTFLRHRQATTTCRP